MSKFKEEYDTFNKWYTDFLGDKGGYKADRAWFDRVQESHLDLRERIGGIRRTKKFNIEKYQEAADIDHCQSTIRNIEYYLPDMEEELLGGDINKLLWPTIQIGKRNIRTNKAILTYANKYLKGSSKYHTENTLAAVNSHLSLLAAHWDNAKTQEDELTVMMTTAAKGFALIGHLNVDENSCFRQTSQNQHHKYILGQSKDTFVLLVKKDGDNLARFWGYTTPDYKTFTLSNLYNAPEVKYGNIFAAVKMFFADLFDVPKEELKHQHNVGDVPESSVVYWNGRTWSFSSPEPFNVANGHHILETCLTDIVEGMECPHCREWYDDASDFGTVDEILVCDECFGDANYCDHTQTHTFEDIYEAIGKDGYTIYVKESALRDLYVYCQECSVYYLKSKTNGSICSECQKLTEEAV